MLDRRALLKNTILSSTGLIVLSGLPSAGDEFLDFAPDELGKGFLNPPISARPQAFWMWMNGHITKKGITLDLQRMKNMGLAGAFIYNTGTGIPKGPVDYGSNEWDEMVIHAMTEAKRLGLEMFLHNSPGFSSTGGPWVLPEMTMQQLVWSEAMVNSNGSIDIQLPQPYKKLNYYKDAVVIAYPSLVVEKGLMKDKVVRILLNETEIDQNILLHKELVSKIELNGTNASPASLLLEFADAFEARAITVLRQKEPAANIYEGNYDNPPSFLLESSDNGNHFQTICTIHMPLLRFMDAPGTKSFPAVKAKYFRLSTRQYAAITDVELHAGPRLSDWPAKINCTDQEIIADNQEIENELIIDPSKVLNITDRLQPDGRLIWNAGAGNWTILRIGHTCTGTKTAGAPGSAFGLEIDKFSKDAVKFYFETFLNKLFHELKPFAPNSFKGVLIDSWEIGKQNWTSNFISDFKQKRNYDITPWLPALTGRIVKSTEHTEKVLWDLRKTHADLVAENYYGEFKNRCKEYKLALLAQPNGDGVFDSLQVGQYPDSSLAEFWTRYVPGTLNVCKQAVSIAHGYGKKIVAAEAYTGMPSTSRWTEYPYALKSQGDHIYSMGINRFVFHVFVHQPYSNGLPGMTMGPYGTHFDRNSTWADRAKEWINYITRTQYLIQQGVAVCDICYFKGEDPGSGIPDINYVDPPTPKYLAGDVIGPDVLLTRIKIDKNKIVLPDGMSYSVMIMAPVKATSLQVVSKLKELVFVGMNLIVTSKPSGTPGLDDRAGVGGVDDLVNELWGNVDGLNVKERSYGKGRIYWNKPFAEILAKHKIIPDFEFTAKNKDAAIHFTHRKTSDSEIYFLSNRLRRQEKIVCSFRFYNKQPEIWNAETGEIFEVVLYEIRGDRIFIPVELESSGSLFVIFRNKMIQPPYKSVLRDSSEIISTRPFNETTQEVYQKVINNFTIALWVKPDTLSDHPKGVIIFPPEAEILYGQGHAACGLAAGQNGVRVFEREKGPNRDARQLITSTQSLQGWTHLAVRYDQGKPSLLINGMFAGMNDGSGKIIHPGLDTAPTDELMSAYFEGNHTKPHLYTEALSDEAIKQLFKKGIPPPELPSSITLKRTNKVLKAMAWENGNYLLKANNKTTQLHIKNCKVVAIENPWQIKFLPNLGAPSSIQLKELHSLHLHPDFDVKYFSGTATYTTSFLCSAENPLQKVLLDLGRVEVIAEVRLNGKALGVLWKEPYRLDITKTLSKGNNKLEIAVTNLWPNRMIGDEHLPKENNYDENGFIVEFPAWYINNKPKPGQRITFSAWNNFKKTDPLLEAGLLGPVRLIMGVEKIINN